MPATINPSTSIVWSLARAYPSRLTKSLEYQCARVRVRARMCVCADKKLPLNWTYVAKTYTGEIS